MSKGIDLQNPEYYENRELSWLEFNQRVLEEAENHENPLFERMKFLAIVSSNLDEFFMVRVASLIEQVHADYTKPDFAGLTPAQQLKKIAERTHRMVKEQGSIFRRSIQLLLKKNELNLVLDMEQLTKKQIEYLGIYFEERLYPVLTPLAVDSGRPFPVILNKSLNIGVLIQSGDKEQFATVQVPAGMPRYLEIPSDNDERTFVLLEDIIKLHIKKLFLGKKIICAFPYRITRNADLSMNEEEAEDLLLEIEKSIKQRKWGQTIRLEIDKKADKKLVKTLKTFLQIQQEDIYFIEGPIDVTFLMKMYKIAETDHLKYRQFEPAMPKGLLGSEDIFETIKKKDIIMHHPFESFDPVVKLVEQAAKDKDVLAIKQTLYRVSGGSPIVKALEVAAEAGKQVTVLVELKARFDEENNIQWARRLEKAGCHVIYGLIGLKTHSKVTLIVRNEEEGMKRYVHLGTGNYNDITAKLYTDMGLLTMNEQIGADVSAVFNAISGYSEPPKLNKMIMAPMNMRDRFLYMIRREAEYASQGKKARIVCKMNALCDGEIIQALYEASIAGVKIELIVRGICCAIPDIPKVSENIKIRSIVGKYLEHSRIYCFYNDGKKDVYLSSADWMPRNLNRRVELLFPIEDEEAKKEVYHIIDINLKDVVKAKIKDRNGNYVRIDRRGKDIINSQEVFEDKAMQVESEYIRKMNEEVFRPVMSEDAKKI